MSSDPNHNYKRPESVIIVIHNEDGHILLLKRSDIENFWQSVTGSLRWHEQAGEAAVRELREETGIRDGGKLLDIGRSNTFEILPSFRSRYGPQVRLNKEHIFSLQVPVGQTVTLNAREHVAFQWVSYTGALDWVWSWSNRDAIKWVCGSVQCT